MSVVLSRLIDRQVGLSGCGEAIAHRIAQYPTLGDCLLKLFRTRRDPHDHSVDNVLDQWRKQLANYLAQDPLYLLARRQPLLASRIPDSFPNPEVINALLHPAVTEDKDAMNELGRTVETFPTADLGALKCLCMDFFNWDDTIVEEKFKSVDVFQGLTFRLILNEVADRRERMGRTRKSEVPLFRIPSPT